jgi:hypothetical protein
VHLCLTPNLEQAKWWQQEVWPLVVLSLKIGDVTSILLPNSNTMITSAISKYIFSY